ncbi:MAG: fibronectin type III domain-containing protein [Desulfosarcina sp.]|nr:fibronectin type III domain-containing protein [Desulfobacterales bacterium]
MTLNITRSAMLIIVVIHFLIPTVCFSASVDVKWKSNKEADLAGYNLYYGTSSRKYGTPVPVGKSTNYSIDNLKNGTKYYFAMTARDNSGNESGFSSEVSATATSPAGNSQAVSSSDAIKLSSKKARKVYGNVPKKDRSHVERVKYYFAGKKGSYKLKYCVFDVDNGQEVKILLNGRTVGYAALTKDNKWSKKNTLILQDSLVNDSGNNTIEFVNTYNPPNQYSWGVKKVNVKRIKAKKSKQASTTSFQSNEYVDYFSTGDSK